MSDSIIGDLMQVGFAMETATVGNETAPDAGIAVLNKATIDINQTLLQDRKATGNTVLETVEIKDDIIQPGFVPETTCSTPFLGQLLALLTQNAIQSGAGPWIQTVEPDNSNGKIIDFGSTIAAGSNISATVKQALGIGAAHDLAGLGGIVTQVDMTFGESGRVKVTPTFAYMNYLDNDTIDGTLTLPTTAAEKMVRDWQYKLGNGTPTALYSKEITLSFVANVVKRHYAGFNDRYPFRFVYNGWSLSGSFSRPAVSAVNTLRRDWIHAGGDQTPGAEHYNNVLLYLYTTSDYSVAPAADGEMLLTLNLVLESAIPGLDDETIETVNFIGAMGGTDNIWEYVQATTATQAAWAA